MKIGRYRADFLFPDDKVIVEVDSWAHPITWNMLRHEPEATIARIAAAIALASTA